MTGPRSRAAIERWGWRLAPVGAALVSLALGLLLLGRRSLSPDEAQTADLARRSGGQLGHLLRTGELPHHDHGHVEGVEKVDIADIVPVAIVPDLHPKEVLPKGHPRREDK